jgi:uncharacterized protein YfaQ (DUF2300 family)
MKRCLQLALLAAALGSAGVHAAPPPTRLAWLHGGELSAAQRNASTPVDATQWRTPLGSSWKLFMHAYLHANAMQEAAYRCQVGQRQPDDEYCCEPGQSVSRDEALAHSCGPYFDPQRLGVNGADWTRFWKAQDAPVWLTKLEALQPGTQVPVADLLKAIERIPSNEKTAARQALMPVALRDSSVAASLGSGPRYKTWSWQIQGERAGGAAGWLLDGTPFWFGAPGTSKTALNANAAWIASQWPTPSLPDAAAVNAQPCIEVSFFQRYPIRSVTPLHGGDAPGGAMNGRYRISFINGTQIVIEAVPAMTLQRDTDGPHISARLALEDYVARVVDREGDASEVQAARALAIAARTYALQNSTPGEGCRLIADDSRAQRVSPNPPTASARAAAAFTDGMVVEGVQVRYHSHRASQGVLSWQQAVEQGRGGMRFDEMLRRAYPGAALGPAQGSGDCEELPQAAQWLASRQLRWRQSLREQPGFEPVGEALRVCRLETGTPHSDQRRLVIRIREWTTREGRVTLIHEFLHLAYRHHPVGRDEAAIERLAQRLADS